MNKPIGQSFDLVSGEPHHLDPADLLILCRKQNQYEAHVCNQV